MGEEPRLGSPVAKIFSTGDRVMCFHGPLAYEAKILGTRQLESGSYEYLIHYIGWNKSWDEWVNDLRILDYNEETIRLNKILAKSNKSAKRKKVKRKESDAESGNERPKRRKKGKKALLERLPDFVETEEQFLSRLEVKISIPLELKQWICDDIMYINEENMLVVLPAKINIYKILDDYLVYEQKQVKISGNLIEAIKKINPGLIKYFDDLLPETLLFKSERKQYHELMKKYHGETPSQLYGAHHFLRLFVRLGRFLVYTSINQASMNIVLAVVHDFLKFLVTNMGMYFTKNNYK